MSETSGALEVLGDALPHLPASGNKAQVTWARQARILRSG
jgi:hypothetical protein